MPKAPGVVSTVDRDTVEALMRGAREFAGITAASIAQAGDGVTLPQLRVLVLASSRPTLNATGVAEALNVHLSNASRICDRLVHAGLLDRRESGRDRRHVELSLTGEGERLVETVMDHRRQSITRVLQHMPEASQQQLAQALSAFMAAAEAGRDLDVPSF